MEFRFFCKRLKTKGALKMWTFPPLTWALINKSARKRAGEVESAPKKVLQKVLFQQKWGNCLHLFPEHYCLISILITSFFLVFCMTNGLAIRPLDSSFILNEHTMLECKNMTKWKSKKLFHQFEAALTKPNKHILRGSIRQ